MSADVIPDIEELDSVRLKYDLGYDGEHYFAGTIGVAVYKHRDGEAYEVELFEPAPAVVTMRREDLELVTRAP